MSKIKKILVPFDFSETSKIALQYAVDYVGQDENLKILLAYISNIDQYDVLDEAFEGVKNSFGKNLKHELQWISMNGKLSSAVLYIQKEEAVNLVIMGTADNHEEEESNTAELVLKAECPVLVIPSEYKTFKIENIALVLGSEEIEDNDTLGILLDVARRFNAKVHVVTIENKPKEYGYSKVDERNEGKIQYYLENFYSEHTFIENTDVVKGILEYASGKNIDMITILPRNHSKQSNPSEGKLTRVLTLQSKIPVLAID